MDSNKALQEVRKECSKNTDEIRKELRDVEERIRQELKGETKEFPRQLSEVTAQAREMLSKMQLANDRDVRFHERDWPALVNSMHRISRRLNELDHSLGEVRVRNGMSARQTPAEGIEISMIGGIPQRIDTDGDR